MTNRQKKFRSQVQYVHIGSPDRRFRVIKTRKHLKYDLKYQISQKFYFRAIYVTFSG